MHSNVSGLYHYMMRPIELRIKKSTEWTVAVLGLIFFFSCAWAVFIGFVDLSANDFRGMRSEALIGLLFSFFGAGGFRLLAAFAGVCSGAVAIGALWRLNDSRPSLLASPDSFWLHPSILGRDVGWADLADIRITRGSPTQLSLVFTKHHISLYSPIPSRKVRIPIVATGWSYRTAETNLRSFRKWRRDFMKLT